MFSLAAALQRCSAPGEMSLLACAAAQRIGRGARVSRRGVFAGNCGAPVIAQAQFARFAAPTQLAAVKTLAAVLNFKRAFLCEDGSSSEDDASPTAWQGARRSLPATSRETSYKAGEGGEGDAPT